MKKNLTVAQQVALLPQPYRFLAEKYKDDQRWSFNPDTDWDKELNFLIAFSFVNSDEGEVFWFGVYRCMHTRDCDIFDWPPIALKASDVHKFILMDDYVANTVPGYRIYMFGGHYYFADLDYNVVGPYHTIDAAFEAADSDAKENQVL